MILCNSDFFSIKKLVYDPCKFVCSQPVAEAESSDYGACTFQLNGRLIRFRVAKITPTKVGQFVTLWKRKEGGPIEPYDTSDSLDLVIVSTRQGDHFGHFVFPKAVLREHGVLSVEGKGGKRALRVYPPWDRALNSQAQKTQKWQSEYFLEIPNNKSIDFVRAQRLYSK